MIWKKKFLFYSLYAVFYIIQFYIITDAFLTETEEIVVLTLLDVLCVLFFILASKIKTTKTIELISNTNTNDHYCKKCKSTTLPQKIYCKKHTIIETLKFLVIASVICFSCSAIKVLCIDTIEIYNTPDMATDIIFYKALPTVILYMPFFEYLHSGYKASVDKFEINYIAYESNSCEETYQTASSMHNQNSIDKKVNLNKRLFSLIIVISCLSIVACIAIAGIQYNKTAELKASYTTLQTSYDELISLNVKLTDDYERVRNDLYYSNKKYNELNNELNELKVKATQMVDELSFYNVYAACVDSNSKYYHEYSCMGFDSSSFNIYNIDLAESKGYKPCPICKGD